MFLKHRRRRVLYNDDADQQYVRSFVLPDKESYGYDIVDDQSFLDARPCRYLRLVPWQRG